jgi:hypothetical protein
LWDGEIKGMLVEFSIAWGNRGRQALEYRKRTGIAWGTARTECLGRTGRGQDGMKYQVEDMIALLDRGSVILYSIQLCVKSFKILGFRVYSMNKTGGNCICI